MNKHIWLLVVILVTLSGCTSQPDIEILYNDTIFYFQTDDFDTSTVLNPSMDYVTDDVSVSFAQELQTKEQGVYVIPVTFTLEEHQETHTITCHVYPTRYDLLKDYGTVYNDDTSQQTVRIDISDNRFFTIFRGVINIHLYHVFSLENYDVRSELYIGDPAFFTIPEQVLRASYVTSTVNVSEYNFIVNEDGTIQTMIDLSLFPEEDIEDLEGNFDEPMMDIMEWINNDINDKTGYTGKLLTEILIEVSNTINE